jgi:hypothetical protein
MSGSHCKSDGSISTSLGSRARTIAFDSKGDMDDRRIQGTFQKPNRSLEMEQFACIGQAFLTWAEDLYVVLLA